MTVAAPHRRWRRSSALSATAADEFADFHAERAGRWKPRPPPSPNTSPKWPMRLAFAPSTRETPAGLVRLLRHPAPSRSLHQDRHASRIQEKGQMGRRGQARGPRQSRRRPAERRRRGALRGLLRSLEALLQAVASRVLADLIVQLVQPVLQRFRDYKRSAALLDFDDLIFAARDLLRDHDDVRRALAARFAHVLVDEFQDTDPLQTEIFWRLCGEPPAGASTTTGPLSTSGPARSSWSATPSRRSIASAAPTSRLCPGARRIPRPGPRTASCRSPPISAPARRSSPMSTSASRPCCRSTASPASPRWTPFHADRGEALCVAALDVAVADENGKASAEQQRDAEAEAVAEMCARLIGSEMIIDRRTRRQPPLPARRHRACWRRPEAICGAMRRRLNGAASPSRPRPAKACSAARRSRT